MITLGRGTCPLGEKKRVSQNKGSPLGTPPSSSRRTGGTREVQSQYDYFAFSSLVRTRNRVKCLGVCGRGVAKVQSSATKKTRTCQKN